MNQAAEARHQKALAAKQRVRRKLEEDKSFRVLYAAVALTFAEQLRQDLANLQAGRQVIQQPCAASSHSAWMHTCGLAYAASQRLHESIHAGMSTGLIIQQQHIAGSCTVRPLQSQGMQTHAGLVPVR